MMRVNLIPAHRRSARERRTRVRYWSAICGAYALLLGLTYACCAVAWSVNGDGLESDLAKAAAEVEDLTRSLRGAEAELHEADSLLDSIRGIAKQPDWSLLLGLVSKTLGDEVVLDTFRLGPPNTGGAIVRVQRTATASASAPRNEPPYTLYISGYARSQAAVSRFVLRLDELDLFDRVDLLKTSREAMFDGDATGFQVQCSFRWQRRTP